MQKWEYCSLSIGEQVPADAADDGHAVGYCHLDVYTTSGRSRREIAFAEYIVDPRDRYEKVGSVPGVSVEQAIEEQGELQSLPYDMYYAQLASLGAEGWEMVGETRTQKGDTEQRTAIWFKRAVQDPMPRRGVRMTSHRSPATTRQEWQYCTLEVSALWGDEDSISEFGFAYSGRRRYTPFGQTWHMLTELINMDSCGPDEFHERDLKRSRLSYPKLYEEMARLGLEGWELFRMTGGWEVEDWTNQQFWFRRPIEDEAPVQIL